MNHGINIKTILSNLTDGRTWLTAFIGSIAIETVFRLAPKLKLSRIDYPLLNGTIIFPPGIKAKILGGGIFYTGAVAWVTLFKTIKHKFQLPLLIKYILFGNFVFLFSSIFALPMLGTINPQMRRGNIPKPGLFGLKLNGWKTPATNFLGHLVFGLVTGLCEKDLDLITKSFLPRALPFQWLCLQLLQRPHQ